MRHKLDNYILLLTEDFSFPACCEILKQITPDIVWKLLSLNRPSNFYFIMALIAYITH